MLPRKPPPPSEILAQSVCTLTRHTNLGSAISSSLARLGTSRAYQFPGSWWGGSAGTGPHSSHGSSTQAAPCIRGP